MRPAELINTALAYIAVVTLANLMIKALHYDKPGIALIVGAVGATEVAAWSYQKRKSVDAPFTVKLSVALLIAVICAVQSIIFQELWHWMAFPVTTTVIDTLGSFLVPLILFGRLQKRMGKSSEDNRN